MSVIGQDLRYDLIRDDPFVANQTRTLNLKSAGVPGEFRIDRFYLTFRGRIVSAAAAATTVAPASDAQLMTLIDLLISSITLTSACATDAVATQPLSGLVKASRAMFLDRGFYTNLPRAGQITTLSAAGTLDFYLVIPIRFDLPQFPSMRWCHTPYGADFSDGGLTYTFSANGAITFGTLADWTISAANTSLTVSVEGALQTQVAKCSHLRYERITLGSRDQNPMRTGLQYAMVIDKAPNFAGLTLATNRGVDLIIDGDYAHQQSTFTPEVAVVERLIGDWGGNMQQNDTFGNGSGTALDGYGPFLQFGIPLVWTWNPSGPEGITIAENGLNIRLATGYTAAEVINVVRVEKTAAKSNPPGFNPANAKVGTSPWMDKDLLQRYPALAAYLPLYMS